MVRHDSEYPGDWDGFAKDALTLIEHRDRLGRMSALSVSRATALDDISQSASPTANIFRQMLRVPPDSAHLLGLRTFMNCLLGLTAEESADKKNCFQKIKSALANDVDDRVTAVRTSGTKSMA